MTVCDHPKTGLRRTGFNRIGWPVLWHCGACGQDLKPRECGMNPKAQGTNPRARGTNPLAKARKKRKRKTQS
jgi:hypothetical protein